MPGSASHEGGVRGEEGDGALGHGAAGAGQAVAEEVGGGVHHGGVPLCLKLAEKLQSRLESGRGACESTG